TTLGAVGGTELFHTHTHIQNSHTHTGTTDATTLYHVFVTNAAGDNPPVLTYAEVYEGSSTHNHSFTTAATTPTNQNAGTGSSQNMPPAIVLNWCITI
ncbi:MAG: hypothetical protein H0X02_12125, partial [Nitrosomonas sp.]|nr:hypothetical protein [Nitrosomonas sp.]